MSEVRTDATAGRTRPAGRRPLWMTILALMLGSGLLWLSSRLTWFATQRELPVRGTVPYTEDGAAHAPALVPLAVLAVAGIAGLLASPVRLRRVLGVLLILAGAGAIWLGLGEPAALFGTQPAGYPRGEIVTARLFAALAGALVIVAGLCTLLLGARMPRMGAGYAAPATARAHRDPDSHMWQALSEGEDPTVSGHSDAGGSPGGDPAGRE